MSDIMAYVAYSIVAAALIYTELRAFRERENVSSSVEGNFTPPPGQGYEYYISAETVVYILNLKALNASRIYLVKGARPASSICLKRDRYGEYITLHGVPATIEAKLDDLFKGGAGNV